MFVIFVFGVKPSRGGCELSFPGLLLLLLACEACLQLYVRSCVICVLVAVHLVKRYSLGSCTVSPVSFDELPVVLSCSGTSTNTLPDHRLYYR